MDSKKQSSLRKLHLGCGRDIKKGWVNLDLVNLPGVDVVHNIEQLPLPFADGSFDEILCQDILEHVEYIPILKDIYRILAPEGKLHIRVPHFTSRNNYADPTHRKLFSISTFDFFVNKSKIHDRRDYYFDFSFSVITNKHITFERSSRIFFYNRLVEWLMNKTNRLQEIYELTFLSGLFPAQNILVTLVK